MGYILSFFITVLMVLLSLIAIMSISPLRRAAGLGNVAPTGPAASFAPASA